MDNIETQSVFDKLFAIDCSKYTAHKGKFSYLSWSYAVAELSKVYPDATWEIKRFPLMANTEIMVPYLETPLGYFVEAVVTINGLSRSQLHPVLDNQNKPIAKPNTFQLNTSTQRAITKAIGLHGLGLYVYNGEDVPEQKPIIGEITGVELDPYKIDRAVTWFHKAISADQDEDVAAPVIQEQYHKLTSDEQIAVSSELRELKVNNRQCNTLLADFVKWEAPLEPEHNVKMD